MKVYIKKAMLVFLASVLFSGVFVSSVQGVNANTQGGITPQGLVDVDGIKYSVSIAKSIDGSRPADSAFANSDTIDLANVTRFDMFYAYLKIDYDNHSGADLTSTSIKMQMPKLGDAGYYELYVPGAPPTNWISYPNTPSGDGNEDFPAANMSTNATTGLMTWTGKTIISGSTGTLYIKIPMRDPMTKFGLVDYKPILNYTKSGVAGTISEGTQFNINGQNDQPTFSLTKEANLGFVPAEPDANQYFYVKYTLNTAYDLNYAFPKKAYEFDRYLLGTNDGGSANINLQVPAGAQIVSLPAHANVSNNTIYTSARYMHSVPIILRYLKTDFLDPSQEVTFEGLFNGRFIGDTLPTQNIPGTEYTLTHQIGTGSVIPAATLGNITTGIQNLPISEDALKIGSVPFSRSDMPLARKLDTVPADELTLEYNGIEYVKNGTALPTDYGITLIYLYGAKWTGNLDPNNPMSGKITVHFNDGTSEVIKTLSEAQIVASNATTLYTGNVPGVNAGYQPPAGKIAKKVVFSFSNIPQGFSVMPWVNGYLTGYPTGGADSLRFNRTTNLYGRDTGAGRPLAAGSGDSSYSVAIARNTSFQPTFTIDRTSTGTVNPGQTDTLKLQSFFSNKATQSFVNPEFDILLPAGYTFDSYTDQTNETYLSALNVFNLPDGILKTTPPVIEQIPNYNSSGRMLVRIQHTGILQESERMGGLLTIRAAQYMSAGNYTIDGYFAAENIGTVNNLSNAYTPYSVDTNDMNGNGQVNDYIFGTVSKTLSISRGVGASLYSRNQGSYDPLLTGSATTKQNTIADSSLTLEYNGTTPMNTIQLLTILPYEGDGHTQYGDIDDGQRVILATPVDVDAYPGSTVYYNSTPTNNPTDAGWTTTFSPDVRAVRVVFPPAFALVSGGTEKVDIPLELQVPGTTDPEKLTTVQGSAFVPIKLYSSTNPAGLEGAGSTITSLALGISVKVFQDENANGIKDGDDSWANNTRVDIFNLADDPQVVQPLYSDTTNSSGVISFLDSFNTVNLALQGYRVVVHAPSGDYSFIAGVGDVTTGVNGQQGVVFNTSNQLVDVTAAFTPHRMTIAGNYWQDYEAIPNGMKDPHDLLTTAGRTVRLFNVTEGVYESATTTIQFDGSYTLPNVVIGPQYRVEFAYNSATESPSALSLLTDNMVSKYATDVLGYTFASAGSVENSTRTVSAAIVENGTINVRFSTDGVNTIGPATVLTRSLPTTYTADIGATADTSGQTAGTFVVPNGYRLVLGESTSKQATINSTTKTENIVFLIELLDPLLDGVKTSTPETVNLHPGGSITYTITVNNTGNEEALNTIISDRVPEFTELVSIADGGSIDTTGLITWNIPTIADTSGTTSVSFTVKTLPKQDTGRWNVVNDQAMFNNIPINNTVDEVTQGLLKFEKVSSVPTLKELLPKSTIDYTIKVSNVGADDLTDIVVVDAVPVNTTYTVGSMKGEGTFTNGEFTFPIETLAPGESVDVGFSVTINADAKKGTRIENTAQVNGMDTNTIAHYVGAEVPKVYPGDDSAKNGSPGTGDSSNIMWLVIFMFTAVGTGIGAALGKRMSRRKRNKD